MTSRPSPLDRLVDVRERELERLAADMATRQALRQRYLGNIERLERLCRSADDAATPSTVAPRSHGFDAALSINGGHFRQSLLQLMQAHREDLARHDAQMAAARLSLQLAARGHEVLRQLSARRHDEARRVEAGQEQHRQDELASHCWQRTRA